MDMTLLKPARTYTNTDGPNGPWQRTPTYTVNCLLRALELAQGLAGPGAVPSSCVLLPLTVCGGGCWDKPQGTWRTGCFWCQPLQWPVPPGLVHRNQNGSQTRPPKVVFNLDTWRAVQGACGQCTQLLPCLQHGVSQAGASA